MDGVGCVFAEKYTPQRSGLRERRRPESPKIKEPSVNEVWTPEEQLELWEIKQYGERQVTTVVIHLIYVQIGE